MKLTILSATIMISTGGMYSGNEIKNARLAPDLVKILSPLEAAVNQKFSRMPQVLLTKDFVRVCQGDKRSDPWVQYCSDENRIYVDAGLSNVGLEPSAKQYLLAHVFGHAIQVRHGVASVALAKIRADLAREVELRGMVTRQVDCIAGVLVAFAGGNKKGPKDWFQAEPFTASH